MIALCPTHAALADAERWTPTQLRDYKRTPFVRPESVAGNYGYKRRDIVVRAGSLGVGVPNAIEIDGERVVGHTRDVLGNARLNLLIRDSTGIPILTMTDDDWIAVPSELFDLDCGARGRKLKIQGLDGKTRLSMHFEDLRIDAFEQLLESRGSTKDDVFDTVRRLGTPAYVSLWSVEGTLAYHGIEVAFTPDGIDVVNQKKGSLHIQRFTQIGGQTAVSISATGFAVGGLTKSRSPPQHP